MAILLHIILLPTIHPKNLAATTPRLDVLRETLGLVKHREQLSTSEPRRGKYKQVKLNRVYDGDSNCATAKA